jgi:biofilm PGA synthesis protein PgaD
MIAGLWLLWVGWLSWLHRRGSPGSVTQVSDAELAAAFDIEAEMLKKAKKGRKLTVFFDENAVITGIDAALD